MEYGSIEREIHIDASPEVVFEVVSSPEHLQEWWPDEAQTRAGRPAPTGDIVFRRAAPEEVDGRPDHRRRRSSRPAASRSAGATRRESAAAEGNSLLVTFELARRGQRAPCSG